MIQRYSPAAWQGTMILLSVLGGWLPWAAQPAAAADPPAASPAAKAPKLYPLCMELFDQRRRSLPEQAKMIRTLGFDGVAYPLWLDDQLDKNLAELDRAALAVYLLYTPINLSAPAPLDPKVIEAIRKLKGRPTTVCVLLQGISPDDPKGMDIAVPILRKLGDAAAEAGVSISIYHHLGDWTQSFAFALEVVRKTDHPRVGANFNVCHWLKIEGGKDYQPLLRQNAGKIFAVTICGAKIGTTKWTDGLIQPLDRGDFDNPRLLATLREIGYRGPIGLMCYGIPGDARDHLQRSIDVWHSWRDEGKLK